MPSLRIALAQVNSTVGRPGGKRGGDRRAGPAAPPPRGPAGRVPGDDAHRLPGRGPGAARLVRDRIHRRPGRHRGRGWPPRGSAESPWSSATWTARRRAGAAGRRCRPAAPQNAAALLHGGQVVVTYRQAPPAQLRRVRRVPLLRARRPAAGVPLPCGEPSRGAAAAVDVAVAICEDLWQDGGPVAVARQAGRGTAGRAERLAVRARQGRRPAGAVRPAGPRGRCRAGLREHDRRPGRAGLRRRLHHRRPRTARLLARGPQFEEALIVADLDLPGAPRGPLPGDEAADASDGTVMTIHRVSAARRASRARARAGPSPAPGAALAAAVDRREVYAALVTGRARLRAQERVPLGHPRAVRRASTRRWSPTIAADAHRRRTRCTCVLDAQQLLLRALGRRRRGPGQAAGPARPHRADRARWSTPSRPSSQLTGLAEENLQARVRGMILMALSNAEGHLVLTTGNKSELAIGYSTLYGDSVGGFGPIKDVPKTLVWELARWRNEEAARRGQTPPIPENSISKPPSAELRPASSTPTRCRTTRCSTPCSTTTSRSDLGAAELVAAGHDPALVERVIAAGGPRRVQAAPVPARARRSRRATSAATGACPSPTAGASRPPTADRYGRIRATRSPGAACAGRCHPPGT